jgi:diketogulonate reductase-like aldo/keto reductase
MKLNRRGDGMATRSISTLSAHGAEIPAIGFGTSGMGNDCGEIVATALKRGYRHLDTAWKYGSERAVGEGMRASGVPRADIFLTTKVSHEYLRAADFARSVDESLANLAVDYVDLLLVHWPNLEIPLAETMAALAKAKRDGLAGHVGVANFNIAMLDEAMRLCPEPLVALQAEYHPYLDQTTLLEACRQRGLVYIAYCPLARGRIFSDPVLAAIARAKGKTIAQIALRWLLQKEIVAPIPRSSNAARIADNLDVFDFTLSADEIARISALKRPDGRIANPAGRAPLWDE